MTARETTRALGGRWYGRYGMCSCPLHDDGNTPALAIKDSAKHDDGIHVHCFAGCNWYAVKIELRRLRLLDSGDFSRRHSSSSAQKVIGRRGGPQLTDVDWLSKLVGRIWRECQSADRTTVETYLRCRHIDLGALGGLPITLKYHSSLKHSPTGLELPAMVGAVQGHDGATMALHRTYLSRDGHSKAAVPAPRMMLGRCATGAVRLAPAGIVLAIAEGIETALSVMQATAMPTWAALSAAGIMSLVLPPLPLASIVMIAADNDKNGAGLSAANKAAARWASEGRSVRIEMPETPGTDWNDALRGAKHVASE